MTDDEPEVLDNTVHTDDEVRALLATAAYHAVKRQDKKARDKRHGISKLQTAADANQNERADLALISAWARVATPPKTDGPAQLTPEQGLQQARGALVAMPAELGAVVREPEVREAIRKAWDADERKETER